MKSYIGSSFAKAADMSQVLIISASTLNTRGTAPTRPIHVRSTTRPWPTLGKLNINRVDGCAPYQQISKADDHTSSRA